MSDLDGPEREALERIVNGAVGRILDKYARESHPGRPAVSIEHIDADVYADAKLDLQAARAALAARESAAAVVTEDGVSTLMARSET